MTTALTPEELDTHLKANKRVYFISCIAPSIGVGIVHHSRTSLKDVNEFLPYTHFYSNYFHAFAHFLKLQQKDKKPESCSAT